MLYLYGYFVQIVVLEILKELKSNFQGLLSWPLAKNHLEENPFEKIVADSDILRKFFSTVSREIFTQKARFKC
jgi:hypothetical protein